MTTPSAAVPRLPWDAADPFPFYERRRRDGDVVWDDTAQAWLILGYHAAQQVLSESGWRQDPLASPNAAGARDSIDAGFFGQSMLTNDGVTHQRLRGAVRDAFAPGFVAGLREGVEAIAEATIGRPPAGEVVDFIEAIALPLPLAVIGEWLGVNAGTSGVLREKAPAVIPMLLPLATADEVTAATAAAVALAAHFLPLAAGRRDSPGDDLLSFIASDPDLLLEEAVMIAVQIAIAGFETIASLLGAALFRLLTPGADGNRLVEGLDVSDPTLITELLRLDGPAQAISRTATETRRVRDVEVAPGQQVIVVLAAANRDPAVFDHPNELRLGRRGPAPLTFGHGPHFCLGAALTRLEVDVALRRTLARDPVLMGRPTWRNTPAVQGPIMMPMTFRAESADPDG